MLQFNLSKYFYILTAEPIWQLLPFRGRLTKLFNSIEIDQKKLPWTPKKVKSYGNPLPFPPFKNTLIWIILLGFIAPTINPSTSLFPILFIYPLSIQSFQFVYLHCLFFSGNLYNEKYQIIFFHIDIRKVFFFAIIKDRYYFFPKIFVHRYLWMLLFLWATKLYIGPNYKFSFYHKSYLHFFPKS